MIKTGIKSLLYRYRQFIVISIGIIWFVLFGMYVTELAEKSIFALLFILLTWIVGYVKYEENEEGNAIHVASDELGMEKKYRIIAVASGKGGVGKTMITANLGVTLSTLNRKVVMIDMDLAMPNLEIITGLKNPSVGLIDVLEGRLKLEQVIYSGPIGTKIIPPGIMLDGYSKEKNIEKIIKLLRYFPIETDYIILDMPPGREAIDALYDGVEALIVINYDKASILDAINMKALLDRKGVNILGAILNRSEYDIGLVNEIEKALDIKVVTVIPDSKVIKDASNNEECFAVTKTESVPSKELVDLAKEIIG